MRTTAVLCAILAGTLGFSTLASAQPGQRDRSTFERQVNGDQPGARPLAPHQARPLNRGEPDRAQGRRWDGPRHDAPRYAAPRYDAPRYAAPRYDAPRYAQPHRYYRGGYLPAQYRHRNYYVNDWRAHQLYAPPAGYQWMQVGSDFLLVALATGLIANLLTY